MQSFEYAAPNSLEQAAPIVPPPGALANAISAATGRRLSELPMSPERVWRALQAAR